MSRRWSDPSRTITMLTHRPLLAILQKAGPSFLQIDEALQDSNLLFHVSLSNDISLEISDLVVRSVTPPLMWGGDPSKMPRYWHKCMTRATVLGRAFAALSPSSLEEVDLDITERSDFGKRIAALPYELRLQIFEQVQMIHWQRQELWSQFIEIFRHGLLSGPDPEPGARFCSAILILTAGKAALLIGDQLTAKGVDWSWMDGSQGRPDVRWTMHDVLDTFTTQAEQLPRDNYRWNELIRERDLAHENGQVLEAKEYVPLEILDIYDKTLVKLQTGEPDWHGAKVIQVYQRDWIHLWQRSSDINQACRGTSTAFNVF